MNSIIMKVCEHCGKDFEFNARTGLKWAEKTGRGRFCSTKCQCESRKGKRVSINTEFKKGVFSGERHPEWKGDKASYGTFHDWVGYHLGKAVKCEECGKEEGRIEWANISHEYKRELSDWKQLCKKCHVAYDRSSGKWGSSIKRFSI